jgi:hypothetical protein
MNTTDLIATLAAVRREAEDHDQLGVTAPSLLRAQLVLSDGDDLSTLSVARIDMGADGTVIVLTKTSVAGGLD